MVTLRKNCARLGLAAAPFLALMIAGGACEPKIASSKLTMTNRDCVVDTAVASACNALDGGPPEGLGLQGYSCTGSARPDDAPQYHEGVPQGFVCSDQGPVADDGTQKFCCSVDTTSCAFNPVSSCDDPTYGYQCRGANRPEAFNSLISCGQGVYEGDLINFCCTGTPKAPDCTQSDSVVCSPRLMGWTCLGQSLPKSELLGASKSHADLYTMLCPVPAVAPNPKYNNYCCYTPALVPEGGSCVQDTAVPGCDPGRFGFACYGPETPEADYLPMHCPDPGVPGRSAEGFAATLYCCDFE